MPLEGVIALAAFAGLFAGYAVGRRQGRKEGFREGLRWAPLEMRRLSWEKGHCLLCGAEPCEANVSFLSQREEESNPEA